MVLMNENDTNISCDAKAQGCKRTVVFENLDAAQHGLGDKIILGVGDTGLLCR